MIAAGDKVPNGELLRMGAEGPEAVSLSSLMDGRKVVIFALPGAYTGTCTTAHVPSFMRNMDALKAKGVEDVICVAVNDPFVMKAWSESTGAGEAGIHMLGDASGDWTKAMGMEFDAPPAGFHGRSKRYAMVVDDGTVTVLQADDNPGVCDLSGGEAILDTL